MMLVRSPSYQKELLKIKPTLPQPLPMKGGVIKVFRQEEIL
jgi:hypothetical protein